MMKKIAKFLTIASICWSSLAISAELATGPWRFALKTLYAEIPFIITIKQENQHYVGILHNGKEMIKLNDISLNGDKVSIPLQNYEMSLEMKISGKDIMRGNLVRHNKDPKVETPVVAIHGLEERFSFKKKGPHVDLTGKWAVTMKDPDGVTSPGILIFEQEGHTLHGSLLTPTGDYRYFEGYITGSSFEVASFDGVYNYLISGSVKDGKLSAAVSSGSKTEIHGKKDNNAKLPDAYEQTKLEKLSFSFPDLKGKKITLDDPKFKNKPVIVQFFGSWCPNCMDEMNFLIPWYKNNKQRGIEIVALAFERSRNEKEALIQLKKVQKKKRIPYTLLVAGTTSEDKPKNIIKGLENFISFPTTVFLNKKHEVVKVHAGFTGPGTGEYYEQWIGEFNKTVADLLK